MNTPNNSQVPLLSKSRKQNTFVVAIVLIIIIALGLLIMKRNASEKITTDAEQRQAILDTVAADSQKVAAEIPEATKQSLLDQVSKSSNPTPVKAVKGKTPAPTTPMLTDAEKATILQQVAAGSKTQ